MNIVQYLVVIITAYPFIESGADGIEMDDFDKLLRKFVDEKSKTARKVDWWDAYGKHQHLKDQYPDVKTNVKTENFAYGRAKWIPKNARTIDTQIFNNRQSVEVKSEFSIKEELITTYTWTMSNKLSIGLEVKISAGVPGVASTDTTLSTTLDLQKEVGETIQKTQTKELKQQLTIPCNRTVVAQLLITDQEIEIPWTADVLISGQFAIWFKDKFNGHYLHFYSVQELENEKFVWSTSHEALTYKAEGIFRSVKGSKMEFDISEYFVGTYKFPEPRLERSVMPKPTKKYSIDLEV